MIKPTINFDTNNVPQGNWTWYYGTLTNNGKDYPFSLLEMYEPTSGTYSHEVTWVEETPEDSEKHEDAVIAAHNS